MTLILRADDVGTVRINLTLADVTWQRILGRAPLRDALGNVAESRVQEASEAGWTWQVEIECFRRRLNFFRGPSLHFFIRRRTWLNSCFCFTVRKEVFVLRKQTRDQLGRC